MKKRFIQILLILLIVLTIYCSFTIYMGYDRYRNLSKENSMETTILNIMNQEDYIPLAQISPLFIKAIIAVEDEHFYDHNGIQLTKLIDAFITDLIHFDFVKGGSTISQQLSKNLFLDQEKELSRKIAELFFVRDLESTLTKDEILEIYLNIIYFGDGYYGIDAASHGYYQKHSSELTLNEATMLAGLPQAPAIYQLSTGLELAKKRQVMVLDAMRKQELISESDYQSIVSN